MRFFKTFYWLIRQFALVSWHQGIRMAIQLAANRIRERGVRAITPAVFPEIPSNSSSYLHLLPNQPLVSIVMPVFNSRYLRGTVDSVLKQSYPAYELILVDDQSTEPETLKALDEISREAKVRVIRNPKNLGISGATNAGINEAKGDFIAFMDHDDLIHPDALAVFARTLNGTGRDADVFYTDEARIDSQGVVVAHMRKCPVSLDLLLSCNAVLHFCIIRKTALLRIGLLNPEFDGAQDHDLMLRAYERGLRFHHIPCIVYAWRIHAGSMSSDTRSDSNTPVFPKAYLGGKAMIRRYLDRNGIRATVTDDVFPWYRVKYALPETAGEVAIIIPFKDKPDYLRRFIASMEKTSYPHYKLILVNNRSEQPETVRYLMALSGDSRVRVMPFDEPFNFSRLYNRVVEQVPNEILLFLNNDMEAGRADWLEAMLEHVCRKDVGAVGARLLRPDGQIQHAGVVFTPTIFSCARHLLLDDEQYTRVQREVSGVTAACMMIRKSVFRQVGGFDELHFPIGFSDADLCLKLIKAGYRIIYTPFAELIHHESATRKIQEESYELYTLFDRYIGDTPMNDKHYKTAFLT